MIAAELGLDVAVSKKAALLHDIGKAIDHEVEGTHVELGIKILKKYGVSEDVINGMRSHTRIIRTRVPNLSLLPR